MELLQLEPAALCRMFIADCLITPREPKRVPLTAIDQLLTMYCEQIGAVKPATKVLSAVLRETYNETKSGNKAHFLCAIRPNLLMRE